MATGTFAPSFVACAFAACNAWLLPTAAPAQVRAVPAPLLQLELRARPHGELTRDFPGVAPTIGNGVNWLLAHQRPDGCWQADDFLAAAGDNPVDRAGSTTSTIAITGLALFALAREGPAVEGGRRHEAMQRAARWLIDRQGNEVIGDERARHWVYGHAIAMLGLCAFVGATGDQRAREAVQIAYEYLERHRNPYCAWRYEARDKDNDTSVTTWAVMSYLAVDDIGMRINGNALLLSSYFVRQVTDADGRIGYTKASQLASRAAGAAANNFPPELAPAMTAAGVFCRLASGVEFKEHPPAVSLARILEPSPEWSTERDRVDLCQWFLTGEALRLVEVHGLAPSPDERNVRERWRVHLAEALIKGQRAGDTDAGSWDPCGPWGETGGRAYSTSMAVLALQALHRQPEPARAQDRRSR